MFIINKYKKLKIKLINNILIKLIKYLLINFYNYFIDKNYFKMRIKIINLMTSFIFNFKLYSILKISGFGYISNPF